MEKKEKVNNEKSEKKSKRFFPLAPKIPPIGWITTARNESYRAGPREGVRQGLLIQVTDFPFELTIRPQVVSRPRSPHSYRIEPGRNSSLTLKWREKRSSLFSNFQSLFRRAL
ncbi:hypothetical protein TNCT_42301 [Trichonephila clavata]|uniref:Uncharacterized protein n=1 Tax=Trichonephila clavata TaxID=2740835 RepID=A0A8X6F5Q2_TRICU|nr:hypothetical protein TNCT_42301 [Trichonephila clavata]